MNRALLILNIVLLVLVGVLFYLHFSARKVNEKPHMVAGNQATAPGTFKIAYFDWDSIANQPLYRVITTEISRKEEEVNKSKMQMRQSYQNKVNSYSQHELSQVESENATRELQKMEIDIRNKMQDLDQELQNYTMRKQQELKTKIEDFLKEYNESRTYSYIFVNDPGIMFYRDSAYNITRDLIKGLNQKYPK